MKGVLIGQFWMPEEALHGWNDLPIDVRLQGLNLTSMSLHFLDKIPVLPEKLTNGTNP